MDPLEPVPASDAADVFRLQAEEHPLIEDEAPATPEAHLQRLVHLKAYEEAARHATGLDVLDVGCNTGYGTVHFVPVARRVVGVDVSARAVETARTRVPDGAAEFLVTEGDGLPFPDGTFDLVTAFQVLEHVPDAPAFLGELKRVLRPGGRVILTTPNAAIRLYPGMKPWYRFHVKEYLPAELRALLEGEFGGVRLRGMFGTATLYDTEIRRVDGARQAVVIREAKERARAARAAKAAAARTAPRPLPVRVARAVVPAGLRSRLRAIVRGRPSASSAPSAAPAATAATSAAPAAAPGTPAAGATPAGLPAPTPIPAPAMDLATFVEFTLDDLFFSDRDLDRAMDLLAICEVGGARG